MRCTLCTSITLKIKLTAGNYPPENLARSYVAAAYHVEKLFISSVLW